MQGNMQAGQAGAQANMCSAFKPTYQGIAGCAVYEVLSREQGRGGNLGRGRQAGKRPPRLVFWQSWLSIRVGLFE